MGQAHAFFDSSEEVRAGASIAHTPFMRGHDGGPVQTDGQLLESFQYGVRPQGNPLSFTGVPPEGLYDSRAFPREIACLCGHFF